MNNEVRKETKILKDGTKINVTLKYLNKITINDFVKDYSNRIINKL